jgi:23S rRNA (guanosine2251-2'-O)-methyltransferase
VELEELFEDQVSDGLWIACDQIQDPQNLGAIFRLAGFFGVRGVFLTKDRTASLTSVVYDVASGGVETVPHAIVGSLQQAIKHAKDSGAWIVGTSEHAEKPYTVLSNDRAWVLVLGNEERGLRRLTLEMCDEVCTIPVRTEVDSLNVGTAAAILVSHFA